MTKRRGDAVKAMQFTVTATDGAARRGKLTLPHGVVDTPAFMPVGTYGTVKALSPLELKDLGAQIVLGNTFHLWLRPGVEVIEARISHRTVVHVRSKQESQSGRRRP